MKKLAFRGCRGRDARFCICDVKKLARRGSRWWI